MEDELMGERGAVAHLRSLESLLRGRGVSSCVEELQGGDGGKLSLSVAEFGSGVSLPGVLKAFSQTPFSLIRRGTQRAWRSSLSDREARDGLPIDISAFCRDARSGLTAICQLPESVGGSGND
uniref:Uncharacterized protein n=1 Tax=Chromera velia CCMP2878 TaxID=1169474 RepID=A0A0G4GHF8_9ALVE|eukprot:Cvel_21885.t1-p1 / transcript=Cvel_21885.t1 / gene=Cvel_21885 / organism=Chromera_velia_CCMP2878 / gene_product=hypothetical protein / transcript_product=hypothetical protein / location=Cvel_scaffold2093:20742-21107(+) / protein_length=122 / sequence_SO=supercontig / SO=protein_coding / is_pseudo=false